MLLSIAKEFQMSKRLPYKNAPFIGILFLFAVAENSGIHAGDESDKNHAVALKRAKEGSYGGISRDSTA